MALGKGRAQGQTRLPGQTALLRPGGVATGATAGGRGNGGGRNRAGDATASATTAPGAVAGATTAPGTPGATAAPGQQRGGFGGGRGGGRGTIYIADLTTGKAEAFFKNAQTPRASFSNFHWATNDPYDLSVIRRRMAAPVFNKHRNSQPGTFIVDAW